MNNQNDIDNLKTYGYGMLFWNFVLDHRGGIRQSIMISFVIWLILCGIGVARNQFYISLSRNNLVDLTFNTQWGETVDSFKAHSTVAEFYDYGYHESPIRCVVNFIKDEPEIVQAEASFYENRLYKLVIKFNSHKAAEKVSNRLCKYAYTDATRDPQMPSYELIAGKDSVYANFNLYGQSLTLLNTRYSPQHGMAISE